MKFNFITLFPELISPYFNASILKNAINNNLLEIHCDNPREYSLNKHKKVDDYKIGGGAGMLMSAQPLFDCLKNYKNSHIIFLSPVAKSFKQIDAKRLALKDEITFVCGRYEGIDERVIEYFANEVFSIGDYILTGGELAALCLCDSIARNIPNVIKQESLIEESFEDDFLEAPAFTKPFEFEFKEKRKKFYSISSLIKGNHAKIKILKNQLSLCKCKFHRPDLLAKSSNFKDI
ncbi:tRNA (guanosine(37)-N1)-methyltransferase TrmD [Campylobacter canadensis]|uniref:tRNA (guanine-N(1)-)-methyltransferase n=1 Tax=Campylobacter canadensis TaxID=449520 RepID=A0ABS7WRV5_9BACT|nr:tRNA (guanosine(37)-N1)-methyltransferase TrmD [Campylobacter canadensis]MBZ7987490.1 tRNA (guanosine(37)-N1)-methyltransferase TrmD [Campylobacter canadensis]MBZ7994833.1 tRNA (guanosine(37)-N1)-methyltransferase TrmD [Campylobacter canadensis]MBZ7996382.1 tRNA (guanosine(37)-N1)-methyltransferase TrmD [Campylobacter canadensis]MBZ7998416.1 tRNA (guanosine(37)-N1)-methyltransferase TrmD [Campylobacter canadensis]MBZ8000130.1 tRNA (guanosine(37)-N1)-methyltransferase TrmD [Campylobacter can